MEKIKVQMLKTDYSVTYCISRMVIAYILKSELGHTYHASFCPTHSMREYTSLRESEEFVNISIINFFEELGIQVTFFETHNKKQQSCKQSSQP